ncbi:sulfatase-like hydrolase/transferase [Bdellovibrio sp. NC01]|uniref:sulfatase-like hydrolase/transferase n=1 Tax=Bdellovibrio sp. NC01 TaxID=2220073 RepID=UPI00115BB96E|nr:sulfatase-like hydrolase/transferase [Bdellovibrio sp. NC01]QDK36507.1 hypothetical protein DOE51_02290 [Bdellovibrio sp. NC01]
MKTWLKRLWSLPAFLLTLLLYVLQLMTTLYIASALPRGVSDKLVDFEAVWQIAQFYIGDLCLFIFFYALLATLEKTFIKKFRWVHITLFAGIIFAKLALYHPALIEDLPGGKLLLANSPIYAFPLAVILFTGWIIVGVMQTPALLKNPQKSQKIVGCAFFLGFAIYIFWALFKYDNVTIPEATATEKSKPDVVLVTLDSVNHDSFIKNGMSKENDALGRFLNDSIEITSPVTPVAQTHASLTSLLTGQSPFEHGIRYNLGKKATDPDYLQNSLLNDFKKLGYSTSMIVDSMAFKFIPPERFDHAMNPPGGLPSVLLPMIARPFLFYSLFNNDLGKIFVPSLYLNAAYNPAFRVPLFANKTLAMLSERLQQKEPQFIFLHTCAHHWPASSSYPYYAEQKDFHGGLKFSYTSWNKAARETLTTEQWKQRASYNQALYDKSLERVRDQFIDPVLQYLEKRKKNTIIVLMSDHGENVWSTGGEYPTQRMVAHGDNLLFSARSEFPLMQIWLPNQTATKHHMTFEFQNLVPELLDFVKNGNFTPKEATAGAYTETGLWVSSTYPEQFLFFDKSGGIRDLYDFNPSNDLVFVRSELDPALLLQKQRALIKNGMRLTLHPTLTGFRLFLCDLASDINCAKNLVKENPTLVKEMWQELLKQSAPDFKNGILFPMELAELDGELQPQPLWDQIKDEDINPYQKFYLAIEAYHKAKDKDLAMFYMNELMRLRLKNNFIQYRSFDVMNSWCKNGDRDLILKEWSEGTKRLPGFMQKPAENLRACLLGS